MCAGCYSRWFIILFLGFCLTLHDCALYMSWNCLGTAAFSARNHLEKAVSMTETKNLKSWWSKPTFTPAQSHRDPTTHSRSSLGSGSPAWTRLHTVPPHMMTLLFIYLFFLCKPEAGECYLVITFNSNPAFSPLPIIL